MKTNSATLKVGGVVSAVTVSTENTEFPLPGNFTLTAHSGSVLNINNRFKFLPGSKLEIESGATLNINSAGKLFVYGNGVEFSEFSGISGTRTYTHTHCHCSKRLKPTILGSNSSYKVYEKNSDVQLIVNGTMNIYGTFGGLCTNTETSGIINVGSSAAINSSFNYGMNVTATNVFSVKYDITTLPLTGKVTRVVDGVNTIVDMQVGSTYTSQGNGVWA